MPVNLLKEKLIRRVPVSNGYKVLGPLVLYSKLGAGGMGAVYRAHHLRLGIDVAVKVMKPPPGLDDDQTQQFVNRFLREARTASGITHQNLVSVKDVNSGYGLHYLIMELVDGETAKQRLQRKGMLCEREAVEIVMRASDGLAAAHAKGIVHRDIKPDNIMISRDGIVKVADLGLSKAAGDKLPEDNIGLTMTQAVMGTPMYMSPEQTKNARDVAPPGDVWSMSVSLYQMLTDSVPWKDSDLTNMIIKIRNEPPPDIFERNPNVSKPLASIIYKGLAKEPAARYADCGALADNLRRHLYTLPEMQAFSLADLNASSHIVVDSATSAPSREKLSAIKADISSAAKRAASGASVDNEMLLPALESDDDEDESSGWTEIMDGAEEIDDPDESDDPTEVDVKPAKKKKKKKSQIAPAASGRNDDQSPVDDNSPTSHDADDVRARQPSSSEKRAAVDSRRKTGSAPAARGKSSAQNRVAARGKTANQNRVSGRDVPIARPATVDRGVSARPKRGGKDSNRKSKPFPVIPAAVGGIFLLIILVFALRGGNPPSKPAGNGAEKPGVSDSEKLFNDASAYEKANPDRYDAIIDKYQYAILTAPNDATMVAKAEARIEVNKMKRDRAKELALAAPPVENPKPPVVVPATRPVQPLPPVQPVALYDPSDTPPASSDGYSYGQTSPTGWVCLFDGKTLGGLLHSANPASDVKAFAVENGEIRKRAGQTKSSTIEIARDDIARFNANKGFVFSGQYFSEGGTTNLQLDYSGNYPQILYCSAILNQWVSFQLVFDQNRFTSYANGSKKLELPLIGDEFNGVFYFRSMGDASIRLRNLWLKPLIPGQTSGRPATTGSANEQSDPTVVDYVEKNLAITSLDHLRRYPNLKTLNATGCQALRDISAVRDLKKLETALFTDCMNLTDISPLRDCPQLVTLSLRQCIVIRDYSPLKSLSNLKTIDLYNNRSLTDLSGLENAKSLEKLDCDQCNNLGDISAVRQLSKLNYLGLSYVPCKDLAALRSLTFLRIFFFPASVSTDDIRAVIKNNPNLKDIFIRGAINAPNLAEVDLTQIERLCLPETTTQAQLDIIVNKNPQLRHIGLRQNKNVSDLSFVKKLPNLSYLDLNGNNIITDLSPLASAQSIRVIDMTNCNKISSFEPLRDVKSLDSGGRVYLPANCPAAQRDMLKAAMPGCRFE